MVAQVFDPRTVRGVPATSSPCSDAESLLARVAELEAENARLRNARKFGLVWEERPEKVEAEMAERLPVLVRKPSLDVTGTESAGRPHVLIEGDNLHALTVLQATHSSAVDVIYIDPPYNTGGEFAYNDKFVEKDDRWRHSAWLSFMNRRLRLAHSLLRSTGVALISIDDNEQAHLRLLCDQIFGESNFIAQMVWNGGRKNDSRFVSVGHDYVLMYAKDLGVLKENGVRWRESKRGVDSILAAAKTAWTNSNHDAQEATRQLKAWFRGLPKGAPELAHKHYNHVDEQGRVFFPDNISWPGGGGPTFDVLHPVTGKVCRVPANGWVYPTEEKFAEMVKQNKVYFGESHDKVPNKKTFLDETDEQVVGSVFYKDRRASNKSLAALIGPKKFDFPKDSEVLAWLIHLVSPSKESVILDFFAGSGSTAHAVALLNGQDDGFRQAILVTDNSAKDGKKYVANGGAAGICRAVTQPRIKAALTGKWADGKQHDALPGTLRFYATGFLRNRRNRDQSLIDLARAAADIIAVKDGAHDRALEVESLTVLRGAGKTVAVVTESLSYHSELASDASATVGDGDERIAYLFTWADDGIEPEVAAQWAGWDVRPLPAPLLAAIRRGINAARGTR